MWSQNAQYTQTKIDIEVWVHSICMHTLVDQQLVNVLKEKCQKIFCSFFSKVRICFFSIVTKKMYPTVTLSRYISFHLCTLQTNFKLKIFFYWDCNVCVHLLSLVGSSRKYPQAGIKLVSYSKNKYLNKNTFKIKIFSSIWHISS